MAQTGTEAATTRVAAGAVDAAQTARRMVASPFAERLARFGYAVRGALYTLVGVLAVELATGHGGATTSTRGAIETIGAQSHGKILLILVAIGLAGYGFWGFYRSLADPLQRGHDFKGLAQRAGYLVSGLTYAGLVVPTVRFLMGASAGMQQEAASPTWSARLLAAPGGRFLLAAVGVAWILGGGLGQIYQGWTASFRRDFQTWRMAPEEMGVATALGRAGLIARGVVFGILGALLIQAARNADAQETKGLDGALQMLVQQRSGPVLLGIVACGLICFGVYSFCCARWIRMPQP